jgi:hypothetical protein
VEGATTSFVLVATSSPAPISETSPEPTVISSTPTPTSAELAATGSVDPSGEDVCDL